ncbi:MAG TPA: dCTP deaminase [Polyangiaceae bacterium]
MLSHMEIIKAIEAGDISIDPFVPELVKRNSCLLRLGDRFRTVGGGGVIDVGDQASIDGASGEPYQARDVVVDSSSLTLASSLECISLAPDIVGVLSGISNVARLGVLVHATSAFVNAGFGYEAPSRVTFELATVGGLQVRLRTGIPLCHLAFVRMSEVSTYERASARTGQDFPGGSDLHTQFGRFIL